MQRKPPNKTKQQTHTLRTGCRACIIPASYWKSIISVQFMPEAVKHDPECICTGRKAKRLAAGQSAAGDRCGVYAC
jgi:hypothetical protein